MYTEVLTVVTSRTAQILCLLGGGYKGRSILLSRRRLWCGCSCELWDSGADVVSVCLSVAVRIVRVLGRPAWGALRCVHCPSRCLASPVGRHLSDYASGLMCDTDRAGDRICVTFAKFLSSSMVELLQMLLVCLFVLSFVPVLKVSRMIGFCACTECLQAHLRIFR